MPTSTKTLTQDQFTVADDAVNARLRAARKGTDEDKAAAAALSAGWEAVNALPVQKAADRETRRIAICAFAVENGLVTL